MSDPAGGWKNNRLPRRGTRYLILATLALVALAVLLEVGRYFQPPPLRVADREFLIKPYLQLGRSPDGSQTELVWAAIDDGSQQDWKLEVGSAETAHPAASPVAVSVSPQVHLGGLPNFKLFSAVVPLSKNNRDLQYYVRKNGLVVFQSKLHPIQSRPDALRFDVMGDVAWGRGDNAENQVARAVYRSKPNLVIIAGDVVYNFGRCLEYLDHFFPLYNANAGALDGVPLLRSTLFTTSTGNHDMAMSALPEVGNLDRFPDGLAWFIFWKQPLNGPRSKVGDPNTTPIQGSKQHRSDFLEAAGDSYPRMANYSFEAANCHFLMLDANPYMDWSSKDLRAWVENDLKSANKATFKLVVYHQPPFSSDTHHFTDQQMRVLEDIFQRTGVDVVFSGHVHNYQRTRPLKFTAEAGPNGRLQQSNGIVAGTIKLDKDYDGQRDTHPQGIIHIVTGCGGAVLSGAEIAEKPELWQPFTARMAARYSFTQCDVDGKKLVIRQMLPNGEEMDRFEIDKTGSSDSVRQPIPRQIK